MDDRHLLAQSVWHRFAVGFVLIIQIVAKCFVGDIKRADEKIGLPLFQKIGNVSKKTVGRTNLDPLRASHGRQCMEDLVDERMRVDKDD